MEGEYAYIPKSERGKPDGAVLWLRELTIADVVVLEDALVEPGPDGTVRARVGSSKLKKFLLALVGWERVKVRGVDVMFGEAQKLQLPPAWYHEVADVVTRRTELGEADEGN